MLNSGLPDLHKFICTLAPLAAKVDEVLDNKLKSKS